MGEGQCDQGSITQSLLHVNEEFMEDIRHQIAFTKTNGLPAGRSGTAGNRIVGPFGIISYDKLLEDDRSGKSEAEEGQNGIGGSFSRFEMQHDQIIRLDQNAFFLVFHGAGQVNTNGKL